MHNSDISFIMDVEILKFIAITDRMFSELQQTGWIVS